MTYKDSFSRVYDFKGSLLGYIGYGFFIRKVLNPCFIVHIDLENGISYPISTPLNKKGYYVYNFNECSFEALKLEKTRCLDIDCLEHLELNSDLILYYSSKFEEAKKFCLVRALKTKRI